MRNAELLAKLFTSGAIRLQPGTLFANAVAPKPSTFDFGKVEGMLLGIAVGDALGATTESMTPSQRRKAHSEIRDHIPNRHVDERRGFPSDDTQLSFWTLA